MRKLISIFVALGLLLSISVMATPVAAVEEGTVVVGLSEPIAKAKSNYCIQFHNIGTLWYPGDYVDYIDLMFPTGTNVTGFSLDLVQTREDPPPAPGPSCDPASLRPTSTCNWSGTGAIGFQDITADSLAFAVGIKTIRVWVGGNISKCNYVLISVSNITNPTSCTHHLEVGTSAHTPVDSLPYTIYCAKIALEGGIFPATGYDYMNLISLPCYPEDTSIEVVLETLFCKELLLANTANPFTFSVWYWDNDSDTWLKYVSDSSFTDLDTIEPGKAYWIKPSTDTTIWIHGDPYPGGQGPPIKWCYPRCWNMVGFASLEAMNASKYLEYAKIPPMYTNEAVVAIWGWDVVNQWYDPLDDWGLLGCTGPDCMLERGKGYWMAFLDDACIIPPAQADC